jgi:hypothetical protein
MRHSGQPLAVVPVLALQMLGVALQAVVVSL